jgi:transposase-like protein
METKRPETLIEAIRFFTDADNCHNFATLLHWPDGVVKCPTCGRDDVRFVSTRRIWECKSVHTKKQFSAKIGTIFEDSPIGLDKWFAAVWMIANDKNGISSYEMARSLGVTQKSAWFMLHRIRLAMQSKDYTKLDGTIEVDETFIGGKARFMHRSRNHAAINGVGPLGKTAIVGLLDRHGPDGHSVIKATVIKDRKLKTLNGLVRKHVEPGSEVFTDALQSYNGLEHEYIRGVVDHAETYVEGNVHTNGIENFWTLLKRALKGTYVSVEPFHLFRYLDEEAFRFNNRQTTDGERFLRLAANVVGKRLTFKELIGHD